MTIPCSWSGCLNSDLKNNGKAIIQSLGTEAFANSGRTAGGAVGASQEAPAEARWMI